MKRLILFLLSCLFPFIGCMAQDVETEALPDDLVTEGCTRPEPLGGQEAFGAFVMQNFNYPSRAWREARTGFVHLSFVVRSDGTPCCLTTAPQVHTALFGELKRILYATRWVPGMKDSRYVTAKADWNLSLVDLEMGYPYPLNQMMANFRQLNGRKWKNGIDWIACNDVRQNALGILLWEPENLEAAMALARVCVNENAYVEALTVLDSAIVSYHRKRLEEAYNLRSMGDIGRTVTPNYSVKPEVEALVLRALVFSKAGAAEKVKEACEDAIIMIGDQIRPDGERNGVEQADRESLSGKYADLLTQMERLAKGEVAQEEVDALSLFAPVIPEGMEKSAASGLAADFYKNRKSSGLWKSIQKIR